MSRYCACSILLLLFLSPKLFASKPVNVNDTLDNHLFLYEELEYLEDQHYTIGQVSSEAFNDKFKVNTIFAPKNKETSKAYWVRISIKGNPKSEKRWMLEFYDQTSDHIEAYIPDGKGGFLKRVTGDKLSFEKRRFKHKNFEFEIPNNTATTQDYYFKVWASHHINIIIVLRSIDYFIYYALNEYFLYGIFYGTILIIAIYNFLMYLAIREFQYISYILFLLSVIVHFMSLDGIGFQYLWPNSPEWNQIAYGVSLYSLIFWSLYFSKDFLHTRSNYPVVNKILNITIVVRTLFFLTALVFFPKFFEYKWIDLFTLLISFSAGLYAYKKGYKAARFFIAGYGLLFFGFIIRMLLNLNTGFIPSSILTHYSVNFSFLGQMLLLTFALGDKVRILKNTRDQALQDIIKQHQINEELKDKVNKELETEVMKRTQEINNQKIIIEQANEKLKEQAEEIKKINQLLDKDNFQLKGRIKEKMLERAAHKSMEYDEFKVIFPDELSCLRYLENRKWQKGYSCKKCRNDKFISGQGIFDRRCTRCGYNESPTAFTVFHAIKFPIDKAFYILHLVITERDDLSLEEISKILDLRKNTCGSFKRKILDVIEKNKWGKAFIDNWDNIIFSNLGTKENMDA